MIETISMDNGDLKERITMDYGGQKSSTLGIVAARKAAIESRSSKENIVNSDTLGYAKINEDAAQKKINDLQKMLERESKLRMQAEAKSNQEKQAREDAERRATLQEERIKERERAMVEKTKAAASTPGRFGKSAKEELYARACKGFQHRNERLREQQRQREARMEEEAGSLSIPPATPPRCATRGYATPVCSPSVGRDERGMRTPGMSLRCSESMAPGGLAYRRAPWRGSMPRRQSQSVSVANWTSDHARIARERAVKLGVQKKNINLPRNPGQPVCSFYKKHGYCNAFETRGRCAFDHPSP